MPSTVIRHIAYDEEARRMRVVFTSGDVYDYFAVPKPVYEAFRESRSKGRYFAEHLREAYDYELIEKNDRGAWRAQSLNH